MNPLLIRIPMILINIPNSASQDQAISYPSLEYFGII